ncbi:MAG: tRNA pseudouridine13 synthase [Candidatus Methanomethylophilaceae archaeon]|nr:tRNA pseudouridine13 synthase [Candidatus Methanomethylophilaceae archaeon]
MKPLKASTTSSDMVPIPCSTGEEEIGLKLYYSCSRGSGGHIKTLAEDFVVEEISDPPPEKEGGRFTIATVTSRNWEMNRLVRQLARSLHISRHRIGFAGTKDKRAVTTQLMSFEIEPQALMELNLKDVAISGIYRAARPIQIGDLIGNRFTVLVRDCTLQGNNLKDDLQFCLSQLEELGGFPNYFGVQRFGVTRPITHLVGRHIIHGEFKEAVIKYLSYPSPFEDEELFAFRRELREPDGRTDLLSEFPPGMNFEKTIVEHLSRRPEDYAGALRQLPANLQMMFVHAYQSYMFNLMLSERMHRGIPINSPEVGDLVLAVNGKRVPVHERPVEVTESNIDLVRAQVEAGKAFVSGLLFGTDSVFASGPMGEIERKVVESEGIESKDFLVPPIPHCSSRGSRRELLCPFEGLSLDVGEDSYLISFSLTKGNYATCLLREFMKSEMHHY